MPERLKAVIEIVAAVVIAWQVMRLILFAMLTEAGGFRYGVVPGLIAGIIAYVLLPFETVILVAVGMWGIVTMTATYLYRRKANPTGSLSPPCSTPYRYASR